MVRIFFKISVVSLIIFLLTSIAPGQDEKKYTAEEEAQVGELFEAGNALMGEKKYREALVKYNKALAIIPDTLGPLYNGGLAAFL